MKDKLILAAVIGLLGWLANQVYVSMNEKVNQNRDSIQALIGIHLEQ